MSDTGLLLSGCSLVEERGAPATSLETTVTRPRCYPPPLPPVAAVSPWASPRAPYPSCDGCSAATRGLDGTGQARTREPASPLALGAAGLRPAPFRARRAGAAGQADAAGQARGRRRSGRARGRPGRHPGRGPAHGEGSRRRGARPRAGGLRPRQRLRRRRVALGPHRRRRRQGRPPPRRSARPGDVPGRDRHRGLPRPDAERQPRAERHGRPRAARRDPHRAQPRGPTPPRRVRGPRRGQRRHSPDRRQGARGPRRGSRAHRAPPGDVRRRGAGARRPARRARRWRREHLHRGDHEPRRAALLRRRHPDARADDHDRRQDRVRRHAHQRGRVRRGREDQVAQGEGQPVPLARQDPRGQRDLLAVLVAVGRGAPARLGGALRAEGRRCDRRRPPGARAADGPHRPGAGARRGRAQLRPTW